MIKTVLILCLFFLLTGTAYAQKSDNKKIHVGLVYPLSSNGSHAPQDTNKFSLNIIAGVSAAEDGFTLSGLSSIIRQNAKGTQIAGFSNHIGGSSEGTLVAGFLNTYGDGKGAAIAGFMNKSKNVTGVQLAGFANLAKNVNGVQIAGFTNLSEHTSSQVAGFLNIAKDVSGTQIAGFMNKAKKVKGAQIAGFINIADSSDYTIGIINLVKNGEKSISVTFDENQTSFLSFRSGGRVMYGILGIGYNFKNKDAIYGFEAGLGAHAFEYKQFRLNLEITNSTLTSFKRELNLDTPPKLKHGEYWKSTLRILPSYKISNRFEIFGGPSLNYLSTNTIEGRDLHESFITKWDSSNSNKLRGLYIGYTAGVQVIL